MPVESPRYELQKISYPVVIQANLPEIAQDKWNRIQEASSFPTRRHIEQVGGMPGSAWLPLFMCSLIQKVLAKDPK